MRTSCTSRLGRSRRPGTAAALAAAGFLWPEAAHAYIDPGSAGFLVTTVLGFLAAVSYTLRVYLRRLKQWRFRSGKNPEDETPGGERKPDGDPESHC